MEEKELDDILNEMKTDENNEEKVSEKDMNNDNTDKNGTVEDDATESSVSDNNEETQQEEEKYPLAQALETIEALKKDMLYKQAEFDNYRKRTNKEKAEIILQGGEKTIKEILPVLDDFERALSDKTDNPEAIREGMNLIYNKFVSTLAKMGVKKIETENAEFNVDFHEAIALVPGMGEEMKGKVIDCTKTGYTLNDKVIRHAQVAVGQ